MWTYHQSSGALHDAKGTKVVTGYSGFGPGKNNPVMQYAKGIGPVCVGMYVIGKPYDSKRVGPYALPLDPMPGTDTKGRGDFRVHGDSKAAPGTASHGCIIVPRHIREQIWESGDHEMKVIS